MLTMIGEVAIELVFVAAVIVAVSCLAYLLTLTVREHRLLREASFARGGRSRSILTPATAAKARVTSLRPSVARQHAAPSK